MPRLRLLHSSLSPVGRRPSIAFRCRVALATRNGHDWTARFPAIARDVAALNVRSAVLDGEALWKRPLEERRLALGGILPPCSAILLSESYDGAGADLFRVACENDLEGIVSKRLDRAYHSGRGRDWLKTKCVTEGEFVTVGFQPGYGAVRTPLANLKIATFDGDRLRYAGSVGTGFSEAVAAALRARLDGIRAVRCAVAGLKGKGTVWVAPDLRSRVAYRGMTTAGELRHASFKGLVE